MGTGRAMSAVTSAITRRWAPVRGNPSEAVNRSTSSPSAVWLMPTAARSTARLRMMSLSWSRSSSSNTSRFRAVC